MLDELQLGSEAYQEAVLQAATHKLQHGPKLLIPGLHSVSQMPSAGLVVPTLSKESAKRSAESFGDLRDTHQVVHPELSPTVPVPEPPVATTQVLLTYVPSVDQPTQGFDLGLEVTDICVDEESVSMALFSNTRFKPKAGMRFELQVGAERYQVCYMGAAFWFPRLRLNGLSFIRITS